MTENSGIETSVDVIAEEIFSLAKIVREQAKDPKMEFIDLKIGEFPMRLLAHIKDEYIVQHFWEEGTNDKLYTSRPKGKGDYTVIERTIRINVFVLEFPEFISRILGNFWLYTSVNVQYEEGIDIEVIDTTTGKGLYKEAHCVEKEALGVNNFYSIANEEYENAVVTARQDDLTLVEEYIKKVPTF